MPVEDTPTASPPSPFSSDAESPLQPTSNTEPWALFRAQTDEALESQAELESTVEDIKHLTTLRDPAEAQERLANLTATSLEPATKELGHWFDKFANPASTTSAAAAGEGNFVTADRNTDHVDRVFQIPELLEKILSPLVAVELLSTMRVSKLFNLTISASTLLRRRMLLEARPGDDLVSVMGAPFPDGCRQFHPGFCGVSFAWGIRSTGLYSERKALAREGMRTDEVGVMVTFFVAAKVPRVGERCRNMFVCAPVVRELEVCRRDGSELGARKVVIHNEKGLRVGDLMDATRALVEAEDLQKAEPENRDELPSRWRK